MTERKSQVKSATAAPAPAVDTPLNPQGQLAERTLRRYLDHVQHVDPGDSRHLVEQSVDEVLTSDVVQSAETVFEHLLFLNPQLDHDSVQQYAPLYEHVCRLRKLQTALLHRAMATLLQTPNA